MNRFLFRPWNSDQAADSVLLSHRTLDSMGTVLDRTLKVVDEVCANLFSLELKSLTIFFFAGQTIFRELETRSS